MKPYRELRWPRFWPFLRVVDELPATKRGRRKASNYGVSIVIRRDVLENESWVLAQEIYESRYWLCHPWRLVDFYWFHCHYPITWDTSDKRWWHHQGHDRAEKAAAHLARVECASRAQEIRAKGHYQNVPRGMYVLLAGGDLWADPWFDSQARDYARSIHGAKNYPWIAAAGWTEEDCYNEIVRNL